MEKSSYPVVTERVLAPIAPKRLFGRAPRRSATEIPEPLSGHYRVYRTRGQYILDGDTLSFDSPTVLEATHVSVVDTTVDTEVAVELPLPSRDGSIFTLRVVFLCTVGDPVEVVRAGGQSAASLLSGYLRSHQRIFEIGLDFAVDELNDVRRKLSAQVRAYATVSPPELHGMTAHLASVEVSTPEELAVFHDQLRATQRSELLDDMKERHQQLREQRGNNHLRQLDADRRERDRAELLRTTEAVGTDPFAALTLAHASGELSAKEFAEKLVAIREQEVAQDLEDLRDRIRHDRQREQRQLEARHESERERWSAERDDHRQQALWDREKLRLESASYAKEIDAKLAVLRELAQRGQLDMVSLRLDKFVNEMLARSEPPALESTAEEQLPAIGAPGEAPVEDEPDDERPAKVEA